MKSQVVEPWNPSGKTGKRIALLGAAVRACQRGTAAYFGEANRFLAWAHRMVENHLKNLGIATKFGH